MTDALPVTNIAVQGLAELTLETADVRQAAAFYEEVVGLRLLSADGDRVWLAVGEQARLGLWSPGSRSSTIGAGATCTLPSRSHGAG